MAFALLFLVFFAKWAEAADFTCPTDPIFRQNGVFPRDVLTLTQFPSNYNCDINFLIEDGFVYKLTIESNVTAGTADSLVVVDAMGTKTSYNTPADVFFAAAKSATISIKSVSGNSKFWFRYEMVPVGQFPSNRLPTGSQSQLRLALPATQAYSFVSPSNDKVVINTATLDNINQVDEKMKKIYVYDGLDLNSPFVGTLYDYVTSPTLRTSSGNVTTIVNFYGTPTDSYALANDFKSLSQYETYNFIVYSNNVTIPNNFQNGVSNAYTFYCTGSGRSYLTDLSFGKDGHKVDFRTLTPSDNVQFLLEYLATGPFARSLPQMIPGKLFTMITLGPELSFTLSTNGDNWLTPYNGRLGTVFSDSLWSPGALPSYNYTFESTTVMKFTFNFHSVIVKKDGEQARVQVGQPGFQPASVTFNHTVTDPGVRVANGTYLTASYIGDSPLSSSIITFEMWNADGTTNAPASNTTATTPSSMESTTKLGSTVNLIGAFVLLFGTMLVKLVVLLFFAATQADVFICPREKIFLATPEGNLTTDLALIPINTKCTISFDIPNGYALNIKFSVDFQSDGDTIQTIDNTNKIRSLPHDGKPITALPFWFAATGAQIKISTVTGDSKFFATYKYLPLDVYYQFQWETGEYFTLSQLSSNSFSTFTSAKKDQVAVTYAKKNKNDVDPELDRIFVYDGPDISKSRMIGTILDVGDTVSSMTSSGESISLVNLYGTKSTSYVLGNDASSLKPYLAYSVIMANRDSGIRGTIGDFTGLSAGYTFICTDCYQFHLTQFLFDSATISNQGYAMFQGQTPTHRKDQLFSYNPSTFTSGYMPQLIPTNIFTVSVHQSKINFTLSTSDNETDWKTPFVGRKGYIFSPSLWNDKPSSNNMNYGTKDLSQSYKYEVNIDKMVFASQNDSLTIQVAINYASPPVKNVYNQTQNPGKVSSDGTRLRIDLNGSPNDDVRISFEIKSAGAGTMGFLVSIILTVFFML